MDNIEVKELSNGIYYANTNGLVYVSTGMYHDSGVEDWMKAHPVVSYPTDNGQDLCFTIDKEEHRVEFLLKFS